MKVDVRRTLSNTFCSLLLLASYLWGGCVSCEQFFMLPGSAGDCCHEGKCKRPAERPPSGQTDPAQTGKDCERMPLEHVRAADSHRQIFVALVNLPPHAAESPIALNLANAPWHAVQHFDPIASSPPDLSILHASLLI